MSTSECTRYGEWSARQYWQYQRRGSWKYQFHGDTLVRYVETAPADPEFAAGLLEYLKTAESVAEATVYNRPAKLGAEWKAVSAWYEQQEGQVDERTKLKVIRVYQALQKCKEGGAGDGPYTVENGCRYRVSFTYHWKVESLPDVPQGTSGVSWQLEQVSRDDETGLWNCCLVRRERVQQDVAEYVTDRTEFEDRSEEQHLGVKAGDVESTGKAASAAEGVLVRRKVQKNEDCTSDVINETVEEKAVEGAAVTAERTLRATVTTTEDRSMADRLPEGNLRVGERVINEKTPGGRWNRKRTVTKAAPPEGPIRKTCQKTVFEHREAQTEVTAERPKVDHAPEAADGKVTAETVRALEDGTYEHELEERQEQEVEGAVEETRVTLRGKRKVTVNRNMKGKASAEKVKVGGVVRNERTDGGRWNQTIEEPDGEPGGVIQRSCQRTALQHVDQTVENVADEPRDQEAAAVEGGTIRRKETRKNEDGTYDVTETADKAIYAEATVTGGSTERTESRTELRNAREVAAESPEENVEVSATARPNEHGLLDGTVVVTRHRPAKRSATGGATNRTVELEVGINQTENEPESPSTNVEVEVDVSPNEHGSMSVRRRKVTHSPATGTATGGTALYDETETVTINDTASPSESGGNGRSVTCRTSPNEHGSATTSKTVRTAKAAQAGPVTWTTEDDRYTYTHSVTVYRNQTTPPTPPSGAYQTSMSLSINEFGRYDAVVTSVTRAKTGGDGGGGQSFSVIGASVKRLIFYMKEGELYKREIKATVDVRREKSGEYHTPMLDGAEDGPGMTSHDDGHYGVRYRNIRVGEETKV